MVFGVGVWRFQSVGAVGHPIGGGVVNKHARRAGAIRRYMCNRQILAVPASTGGASHRQLAGKPGDP